MTWKGTLGLQKATINPTLGEDLLRVSTNDGPEAGVLRCIPILSGLVASYDNLGCMLQVQETVGGVTQTRNWWCTLGAANYLDVSGELVSVTFEYATVGSQSAPPARNPQSLGVFNISLEMCATTDALGRYASNLVLDPTLGSSDSPFLGGTTLLGYVATMIALGSENPCYLFLVDSGSLCIGQLTNTSTGTWSAAPTLTFTGGGSGAGYVAPTATVTVSGGALVITLVNAGQGITSAPTATFTGGTVVGGAASCTFVTKATTHTIIGNVPPRQFTSTGTVSYSDEVMPASRFQTGVTWVLSSTADYVTAISDATMRVDLKLAQ